MLPALVVVFIVVPLLELALILQIGREIGAWWTIGLLVADSILGSLLMRAQGRAVWRRFTQATRSGRPPASEVLDGALIIAGGALLLTPGFLTDALGLSLLLPPTRAVIRRVLARRLLHRMVAGMQSGPVGAWRAAPPRGSDIEGSATETGSERPRGE
ncbi:MAG: FxsA family protein [Solirubrobacterales bacterium]|nr:FxsA family protein [Solirubrobacterales bacterium]